MFFLVFPFKASVSSLWDLGWIGMMLDGNLKEDKERFED